jgi:hypothetical protein
MSQILRKNSANAGSVDENDIGDTIPIDPAALSSNFVGVRKNTEAHVVV